MFFFVNRLNSIDSLKWICKCCVNVLVALIFECPKWVESVTCMHDHSEFMRNAAMSYLAYKICKKKQIESDKINDNCIVIE